MTTAALVLHGIHFTNKMANDSLCDCCPYGFHIDRDFVPFTKKMLSREGEVARLEELKDKWRSERHSMHQLLGIHAARNRAQVCSLYYVVRMNIYEVKKTFACI